MFLASDQKTFLFFRATFDTKATFWKISSILWKDLDSVFAYVYVVGGAREGGGGVGRGRAEESVVKNYFLFFRLLALQMGLKESETESAYNECYVFKICRVSFIMHAAAHKRFASD